MIPESERRKYPRADAAFNLSYALEEGTAKESFSKDFGTGGVSFQTQQEFQPGAKLDLTFRPSGAAEILRANGKVVRSWREGETIFTAVEFTEIDSQDLIFILDYINTAAQRKE